MLGQSKENHRIRFELVVRTVNVCCANAEKAAGINNVCLQLFFSGLISANCCHFQSGSDNKNVTINSLWLPMDDHSVTTNSNSVLITMTLMVITKLPNSSLYWLPLLP